MSAGSESAFPVADSRLMEPEVGLTKRELISAMALQGLLANPNVVHLDANTGTPVVASYAEEVAKDAADTLLAELSKEKS